MASPAPIPFIGTATVGTDETLAFQLGQQVPDVQSGVLQHDAASAPMMSFLQNMPGRLLPADQEDYYWNEVQIDHPSFLCEAGGTGGSATMTIILDYPAIIPGQMLAERTTNQYFIVNSVTYINSGTQSQCVVQYPAGGNVDTVGANTTFIDCAPTMIEGGDYLAAVSTAPQTFSNTTSTGKTVSIEISTQKALSRQYWGWPWDLDKLAQVTRLKKGIERDLLNSQFSNVANYSQAAPTATVSGNLRTTRGVLQTIATNVVAAPQGGTITMEVLHSYFLNGVWPSQYAGSAIKLLLVGAETMNDFNNWMLQFYRTEVVGSQMWGIHVTGYYWGDKRAIIMQEPQFYQTPGLYHGILALDPDKIYMRQYGQNLFEMKDTSTPKSSKHSMAITSMPGMQTEFEYAHSVMYNFAP